MSNRIKVVDSSSKKKNNGFYIEPDGDFLKVTKEQKDGLYTMKVYLFDQQKIEALRQRALDSYKKEKKSFFSKAKMAFQYML